MNTLSEKEFSSPGNDCMIEETKKTCTDCIHYEICSLWTTTDLDEDESYKYCFGHYRPKISENEVVLSKEEYERLLKEETLCERLGNDIDVKLKYIYELEDKVAQVRKETAEKIWNKAKNNFVGFDRISLKLLYFIIEKDIGVDLDENVDEICK